MGSCENTSPFFCQFKNLKVFDLFDIKIVLFYNSVLLFVMRLEMNYLSY